MLIHGDELNGHGPLLEDLKKEYDKLEKTSGVTNKRMDEIKKLVKNLASEIGGDSERVILPAGAYGAWDRVVSKIGAGTSIPKLEEQLGTELFRKLCCVRVVTYEPSPELIAAARVKGKVTDEMLKNAEEPGTPQFSLRKMSPKQFSSHEGSIEEIPA